MWRSPPTLAGLRSRLLDRSALITAAAVILLIAALQWHSGAYRSDFTADEDEPAHVVSSLLIHDYVTRALGENPIHFAETYYLHYPKVAIGHWPPLFYAGEGSWMLLFGRSPGALLTFIAATAIVLLISVNLWVYRRYGTLSAFLAAFALLTPAFVQVAVVSVSPNCLLAVLVFAATVSYGRFLDTRSGRSLLLFALFTIFALGVHGRGAPLLLLPAVAAVIRKPGLLKTWWALPIALLFALVLSGPAILGQADAVSPDVFFMRANLYVDRLFAAMGWPIVLLALAGSFFVVRRATRNLTGIALSALIIGAWLFHSAANAGWADYYLISIAPAIGALAAVGFASLVRILPAPVPQPFLSFILALVIVLARVPGTPIYQKHDLGYHRLFTIPHSPFENASVLLTAGNAIHEGALISEAALHDRAFEHIVLRASKVLAYSWWNGQHYRTRFSDASAIEAFLDKAHVSLVVIQENDPAPHIALLAKALADHTHWLPLSLPQAPPAVRIFQRANPLPQGPPQIQLDMHERLGVDLKLEH